jgi:hypothetical protein
VTSHKTRLGKYLTGCWVTRYADDFVVTSRHKHYSIARSYSKNKGISSVKKLICLWWEI